MGKVTVVKDVRTDRVSSVEVTWRRLPDSDSLDKVALDDKFCHVTLSDDTKVLTNLEYLQVLR